MSPKVRQVKMNRISTIMHSFDCVYCIDRLLDNQRADLKSIKMPKKKKSGKLSKMTDEERIAYEEQKRLAEEEMRKKKEDMLSQFLKVTHLVTHVFTACFVHIGLCGKK